MKKLNPSQKEQLLGLANECLSIIKSIRVNAIIMAVEVSCLKVELKNLKAA